MERVCVTGAGGYIASWVIKLLLSKGYMVHGTVRDPLDEKKNGHLKKLENSEERLQLFKADLLNYEYLCAAINGCTGDFHVASPVTGKSVPNPQAELLDPAILGTQNVMNACLKTNVKKVVVVSSIIAVMLNPQWPEGQEMDETCWTDIEYAKLKENWYGVAKTIAEREALEYAKRSELKVATVCPSTVIGPMLQSSVNASMMLLLSYMRSDYQGRTDGGLTMEDKERAIVDVRDLAEAIFIVYEKPESDGRYICSPYTFKTRELVAKLESMFPGYDYPKNFTEDKERARFSSKKLINLRWKYRPLEESIIDSVNNYKENGLFDKKKPFPIAITF